MLLYHYSYEFYKKKKSLFLWKYLLSLGPSLHIHIYVTLVIADYPEPLWPQFSWQLYSFMCLLLCNNTLPPYTSYHHLPSFSLFSSFAQSQIHNPSSFLCPCSHEELPLFNLQAFGIDHSLSPPICDFISLWYSLQPNLTWNLFKKLSQPPPSPSLPFLWLSFQWKVTFFMH